MILKNTMCLLVTAFFLSNCERIEVQKPSPEQSEVTGTLTIDGKTEKLNNVYAQRIPGNRLGVLVTTKPVPEKELPALFEPFSPRSNSKFNDQKDFLKANQIDGLFLNIDKQQRGNTVSYEQSFIHAGRITDQPVYQQFEQFSLKQGKIIAKCGKASDASFEVSLKGEPPCKEHEGTPTQETPVIRSEQGTAQGRFTMNGSSIELKYAYAQRKRVFFDEPDEAIVVVISEHALSDQEVTDILNQPDERKIQSLKVGFGCENDIAGVRIVWKGKDPINHFTYIEGLSITKERVSLRLSDDKEVFRDRFSYSVSVDVPFRR